MLSRSSDTPARASGPVATGARARPVPGARPWQHAPMTWHEVLRGELADALADAAPDAPTLCEGWQARHLAAHVVLREHSAAVGLGLLAARVSSLADRRVERLADTVTDEDAYRALVARVSDRPPAWHPAAWAGDAINLVEFFVHAQDVRRGAGPVPPRAVDPDLDDRLWRWAVRAARLRLRRVRAGVVLVRDDGVRASVRRPRGEGGDGESTVVVRGAPGELVLLLTGRGAAADVSLEGPGADALTAVLPV